MNRWSIGTKESGRERLKSEGKEGNDEEVDMEKENTERKRELKAGLKNLVTEEEERMRASDRKIKKECK